METADIMEEQEAVCQQHTEVQPIDFLEIETEDNFDETEEQLDDTAGRDPLPNTSERKVAKKRQSTEKVQVYGYMKKKVLQHLEKNGCSAKSVDSVITTSKFDKESILEYMNQRMQMAQMNVHEECNSLSFSNMEEWLECFKKWNLSEDCIYEPALIINAIANNEDIPNAEELNGVDLKSVYKFLGNALLGLPQPKLNEKSAEFLAKEFEILIGTANTDFGDQETLRLSQKLHDLKQLPPCTETSSIDPLCLRDDQ